MIIEITTRASVSIRAAVRPTVAASAALATNRPSGAF
jgi:hypothetical protein